MKKKEQTQEHRDGMALEAVDFTRLLKPFSLESAAIAVSGGPDSMALAWGAKEALGPSRVKAFIVDHRLRSCSSEEAETVKQRLKAMGIETEILRWEHEPVQSRVHVRARQARYDLLTQACRKAGADCLLIAHHRDDQAETILMRFAKGSGLKGLGGMKRETLRDGVRLVRPLLSVPKVRLVATCVAQNIPYVCDASNDSRHYARGRLRRVREALAEEGFTDERLFDLGERAAEAAQAVRHAAETFLTEKAYPVYGGAVGVEAGSFAALPAAVALEALSLLLQSLCRSPFPPRRDGLLRLLSFLVSQEKQGSMTYHHSLVQKGTKKVLFLREPSSVVDIQPAISGQTVFWGGLFAVHCPEETEGLEIRALGIRTAGNLDQINPLLRKKVPSGRLRAGLPALWRGAELVAIPPFSCDYGILGGFLCRPFGS